MTDSVRKDRIQQPVYELGNVCLIESVATTETLAHEIGHAVHYDMLIMTAVQVVPSVMYAIYNTLKDVKVDSSKSKNNAAAVKAGLAFAALILYVVSQYIILWLSRTREYFADEFSVQATCNPNALSRALVQIGLGLNIHGSDQKNGKSMSASKGGALGISDTKSTMGVTVSCMEGTTLNTEKLQSATRWELQNPWAKFYELGSTHPLTSKRIKAIGEMCPQYGQEPLLRSEAFDEKHKSMASAFARDLFIAALPWLIVVIGGIAGTVAAGISGMLLAFAAACVVSLLKYRWIHPKKFEPKEISDLLGEVDVSRVKCIPCEIKGQIIGRGDPGCVFNEDFVMKDESGIMLLDYNQPLRILNKLFALFRASAVQGREVTALGWYRRAPIPFVELKSLSMSDGTKKKCWTVTVGYIIRWVGVALFLLGSVLLYVPY